MSWCLCGYFFRFIRVRVISNLLGINRFSTIITLNLKGIGSFCLGKACRSDLSGEDGSPGQKIFIVCAWPAAATCRGIAW